MAALIKPDRELTEPAKALEALHGVNRIRVA